MQQGAGSRGRDPPKRGKPLPGLPPATERTSACRCTARWVPASSERALHAVVVIMLQQGLAADQRGMWENWRRRTRALRCRSTDNLSEGTRLRRSRWAGGGGDRRRTSGTRPRQGGGRLPSSLVSTEACLFGTSGTPNEPHETATGARHPKREMRCSKSEKKARNRCKDTKKKKSRARQAKLKHEQAELVTRRWSIRTETVASRPRYLVCGKVRMIAPRKFACS